ncbi:MAG: fatty acid desaturase [Bacteroidetes bacterium]|nr:fatty acid desaturase [Bacteroidota bacterium]
MLQGKDLIIATKPFGKEKRFLSIYYTYSSMLLMVGSLISAAIAPWLIVRILSSIFAGFVFIRVFVIYHDYQHKAILQKDIFSKFIMYIYGLYSLAPASIWKRSHDYHHKHNSKLFSASIGSYPIMTKQKFLNSSPKERREYLISRHPITIMLGFFSMFLIGMCYNSFTSNPRKHFDSLIALVLHVGVAVLLVIYLGWLTWFLVWFLPFLIAHAIGAYLFYAQHNFPNVTFRDNTEWAYETAALASSSFMKMNRFMRWSTANIGFHHVHHLNSRIPFYRLPEAMAELPELQHPKTTSFKIRDIVACFKLKLWDPEKQQMIGLDGLQIA